MRILVIHCAYQYKGGEDTVVSEEVELLRNNGYEVEVLLFNNQGSSFLKLLQLPFNISAYTKTSDRIKQFNPDVIHMHNLHFAASPSPLYAAKRYGVPVVMTLHNYRLLCPSGMLFHNGEIFTKSLTEAFPFTAVSQGVYRNSKLITFWLALSNKVHQLLNTYRIPAKVICLTNHAASIVSQSKLKLFAHQLIIKPNFTFSPAKAFAPHGDHFLYVGRLSAEKGIKILLDTFAISNLTVLIAGDGPMKETVEEFASKYPNIYYLGNLETNKVTAAMQAASALVFPSEWFEGMPLTIIEAFACSLPVVASKLGAMESMINNGENGLLFEPGNKADFQKTVYKWVQLSGIRKAEMRIKARDTYEALYSPQKNEAQLTAIYRSVVEKKQPLTALSLV